LVSPKSKAWRKIALAWASVPLAIVLGWAAGYVYWQIEITRSLADLKREAATVPFPETWGPFRSRYRLFRAGSRAIPRILEEEEAALASGDREVAIVLSWALIATYQEANYPNNPWPELKDYPKDTPLSTLRADFPETLAWWAERRSAYPPGWKWWRGRHAYND
jgi:hypothetical protein